MAAPEDLAEYDRRLANLEDELQRRKEIGGRFEATLSRMRELIDIDDKHREEHQVRYFFAPHNSCSSLSTGKSWVKCACWYSCTEQNAKMQWRRSDK